EPQFRYPFFSPLPHGSQAWESLSDSPVTGAPWDSHPRCMTCPSYKKNGHLRFENVRLSTV
ncbi:MAG: hypothetical protein IJK53_02235, partial [Erysipelotrichaceae bacterium]|nr:hypothetical protein [Erysipelotrichaceae bacterium]